MREQNIRRKLGVELRKQGFHVSQIESGATSAGIPDTHYFGHHTDGFIELKVAHVNGDIAVRNTQKAWFRDRIKAGAHHQYMLVGIDNGVVDPQYALCRIDHANVDEIMSTKAHWTTAVRHACAVWTKEIDHVELARIITEV